MSIARVRVKCDYPECRGSLLLHHINSTELGDWGWERRGNENELHVCEVHSHIGTVKLYEQITEEQDANDQKTNSEESTEEGQ